MSNHKERIHVTSSHKTSQNKNNERILTKSSKQPVKEDSKYSKKEKHKTEEKVDREGADFKRDDKLKEINAVIKEDQSEMQDPDKVNLEKEEKLTGNQSDQGHADEMAGLGDPASPLVKNSLVQEDELNSFENIEDLDNNLPETVMLLTSKGGSKVYVVGTVHFSLESQKDVAKIIRAVKPDHVVLELCYSRDYMLRWNEERILKEALNLSFDSVRKVIQSSGIIQGGFYLLLLSFMIQITKQLGIAPGGEFRMAFKVAQEIENCQVWLGDRPLHVTLQRLISSLSIWQITKLVFLSLSTDPGINKEEVENWKNRDALERVVLKFVEELPQLAKVMVDERDMYLAYNLQHAAEKFESSKVVGVVGIGHLAGIKKHWETVNLEAIQEVLTIPPPRRSFKIIKFVLKFSTVGLVLYGVHKVALKSSFYSNLFSDQSYWSMSNMVFDVWDSPVIQN